MDLEQSGDPQTESHSQQHIEDKLGMLPFGWQERFEVHDVIVTTSELHSNDDLGQLDIAIAGHTDALIHLTTGEKVRRTTLESLLRQQAEVKETIAFRICESQTSVREDDPARGQ